MLNAVNQVFAKYLLKFVSIFRLSNNTMPSHQLKYSEKPPKKHRKNIYKWISMKKYQIYPKLWQKVTKENKENTVNISDSQQTADLNKEIQRIHKNFKADNSGSTRSPNQTLELLEP